MAEEPAPQGDRLAPQQTTEGFASVLAESGLPRMPARVFTALLFCDAGGLTSAELTELLSVSPAAISGAVRYLSQLGFWPAREMARAYARRRAAVVPWSAAVPRAVL